MCSTMCRILGGILVVGAFLAPLGPAAGQDKATIPADFSGYLMEYTAKSGSITQITVLQPTPQGKTLQQTYTMTVGKTTKFIIAEGNDKTELDAKTVLTDDKTKDMLVQKAGSTLNDNKGIRVDIETKGKAATKVTFTLKKKD